MKEIDFVQPICHAKSVKILYEFGLFLLLLIFLPKLLYQRWAYGKYRHYLPRRFGKEFRSIHPGSFPLIWIHAVSVGETKAIASLAKMIKEQEPQSFLLITNITETGHAEAKRSLPFADKHLFLPVDFSWVIRPIIKKLKPAMVLITETDLWYNFLSASKESGAKIALVNGKVSERSAKRLARIPFFTKPLLGTIDLFLTQSDRYKERFLQLGVEKERIFVTGNIKLDQLEGRIKSEPWMERLAHDKIIVAGSTHEGEEALLIETFKTLLPAFPELKLILVPRHPERFNGVYAQLQGSELNVGRLSQGFTGKEQILLIDGMGMLNSCYALSTLSLVCGSFVKGIGGHNLFEPALFSKPIIFGPWVENQLDLASLLEADQAAIRVPCEKLSSTLSHLLNTPEECLRMGKRAFTILQQSKGATKKTFDFLFPVANNSG